MDTDATNPTSESPRHIMSAEDFAQWGMDDIAYIKPVNVEGRNIYVIHAADGETMAQESDRETAAALVIQHDMQPVSIH